MPQIPAWRPMETAPRTIDRVWLFHPTLGPILAEGHAGRWYSPSRIAQVWRWYRSDHDGALDIFAGWLPFDALGTGGDTTPLTSAGARSVGFLPSVTARSSSDPSVPETFQR